MLRVAALLVCLLAAPGALALNKCVGPDGKISYSDQPCLGTATRQPTRPAAPTGKPPADDWGQLQRTMEGLKGFDAFKRALDAENEIRAALSMEQASGSELDAMQRYAEASCRKKNRVACSFAFCGRDVDKHKYFSRACAEATGRAYGDNWMELKAGDRSRFENHVRVVVRCLGDPRSPSFAESGPYVDCLEGGRCRHNYVRHGGLSPYFSSLKEAADDACKR